MEFQNTPRQCSGLSPGRGGAGVFGTSLLAGSATVAQSRLPLGWHQLPEAVVHEAGHGPVQVALDAEQAVVLVGVDLWAENGTSGPDQVLP